MKNWKVELTAREKKLSGVLNPERCLPGRLGITIIIKNSDDAPELYRSGDERKKEHLKRMRKILETKLYCRNLMKGRNNYAVLLARYSRPF